MGSFLKLKEIISNKNSFLLIGHERPDGDCLGSVLAFGQALESIGKRVGMVCRDKVPLVFTFLPGYERIENDFLLGDYEAVILLDNGDFRRTGYQERLDKTKIPIINIDHHTKNDLWKKANVNYVDEKASSTAEIIYLILADLNIKINADIATLLLAGIFNDTGGFKHTNTSPAVFNIVSELLKKGAKLKLIADNISNSHSISMLKLWGVALDRLTVNKNGIITSVILQSDLLKTDASEEDVSGLVNLINSIPEAKIAVLLYETSDGKIKGSLRTEKDDIDVSKLARALGGGGHKKASGFLLDGKIIRVNNVYRID